MAFGQLNIGPKRVHFTAYCPDDVLGEAACDFVLEHVMKELQNVTEERLRAWMLEKNPDWAQVFKAMDEDGFELPKGDPFSVDPRNAEHEARIIAKIKEQQKGVKK